MVNQQFFLPMIPDSAPIVINVAQNDFDADGYAGRLIFNLIANGVAYDTNGATATFEGAKPDGTAFAYSATVVSASVIRVNLKKQMTNVTGRVICNLVLQNSEGVVGSFNVWLEVQPSAISGTDPSQTDIPSLVAQAELAADRAEQAADNAEAWSEHPPYIGLNGDWFTYDVDTDLYTDSGISAYANKWYIGTAVSGKSTTPTAFVTGIAFASVNDLYLNTLEQGVYHCTVAGDEANALWVYDFALSGGGAGSLAALSDVSLTNPQTGQILTYDNGQWINKAPDKAFVRYAGAIQFADLATNAATYLTADYEDSFFLISDGGIIDTGEAAQYWTSNFNDGDVIPADSHVAIININRGTLNAPVYKYDDFGGFVDISGKADKTQIIQWVEGTVSNATSVVLPNSGTDSRITANTKVACVLGDDGTNKPVKYSTIANNGNGTLSITFPKATTASIAVGISNA